jgi:hypothetical protein
MLHVRPIEAVGTSSGAATVPRSLRRATSFALSRSIVEPTQRASEPQRLS